MTTKNQYAHFEAGNFYHVYNRANSNTDKLFYQDKNYIYFLQKVAEHLSTILEIWAYCLIPNHFHFLVKVKPTQSINDLNTLIEEQFRTCFISYAQAINKQENRRGSLFQKRFKRLHVDHDCYLMTLIHYIHHNPIHHGLTNTIEGWRYSSYNALVSHANTKLQREAVLELFGNRQQFIEFHRGLTDYNKVRNYLVEE